MISTIVIKDYKQWELLQEPVIYPYLKKLPNT
jgi:hypothetical protein